MATMELWKIMRKMIPTCKYFYMGHSTALRMRKEEREYSGAITNEQIDG